ncbi:hypothetical protein PLICRDRAFT_344720 [Plicaturopsis crispa FD-325 SS-3]|uniref:Unplaced genomic scaffold PLICRscaffold_16, whole genome shotgun sequence n=1 Tax=Plicaturopsis crispa FD-325 SS-3 TaxID=944288 RepID=A0A0C9SRP2_PLICR|nr:hypothetical protein PLICRDRAFT_344720 [Plicaturopsis crispa FD-325 SS-3]
MSLVRSRSATIPFINALVNDIVSGTLSSPGTDRTQSNVAASRAQPASLVASPSNPFIIDASQLMAVDEQHPAGESSTVNTTTAESTSQPLTDAPTEEFIAVKLPTQRECILAAASLGIKIRDYAYRPNSSQKPASEHVVQAADVSPLHPGYGPTPWAECTTRAPTLYAAAAALHAMDYWRNSRLRYGSALEPELYSRLVAAGWISYAALLPVEKNRFRAYRKVEAAHYPWVVQFGEKKPSIEERKRVLRKKLGMKEGEPDRAFDFVDVVEGGEEDVVMAGPVKEEPTQIIEDGPSANPAEVVEQDALPVAGPSTGTKRPRADSTSAPDSPAPPAPSQALASESEPLPAEPSPRPTKRRRITARPAPTASTTRPRRARQTGASTPTANGSVASTPQPRRRTRPAPAPSSRRLRSSMGHGAGL